MKKLSILLTFALLHGCASQTYLVNGDTSTKHADSEQTQHFFVSGIGQGKTTDAAKICGGADKIIKVESKEEPLDIFLGVITAGIYTPRTAKVYCKK